MKKVLFLLVAVLVALPVVADSFTYEYKGKALKYTVLNGSTRKVAVSAPSKDITGSVEIPSVVKDGESEYSVTEVQDKGFAFCNSIISVKIPTSVTGIGEKAFASCQALKNILVEEDNPAYCSISGVLFNKVRSTLICYPAGRKQAVYSVPDSVTAIGDFALWRCSSLTSVKMPATVTVIGEEAFYDCISLTSVNLPSSVTTIGLLAFAHCGSLTKVTIPSGVSVIRRQTFQECTSLKTVVIPESVTTIEQGAFWSCSSLISLTIPNSVTTIGNGAFADCSSLASVTISTSVRSIGTEAFLQCTSLKKVEIPSSVKAIGEYAFMMCSSLRAVYYGAEQPIAGNAMIFSDETYEKATLYLSEQGAKAAATIEPWRNFRKVESHDF